jgi:GTPase Era involved in 16S rRNA processing
MYKLKKVSFSHKINTSSWNGSGETRPDLEKLRKYTQTKLALAEQLRIVRESLTALGREKAEQQCGELLVKLAEDRFVLAVLGQFKRGKSSLMNSIIGKELLPTGVLPLTSAITVLKYGPQERLLVNRKDSILPDELSISSLSEYVTETGNPGNQKKVITASIEVPVPFLHSGIEFVDTPGVGSSIISNTATTYSFLPECDAVLFVTSVDTPMTSMELDLLREIREYVNKIFIVVNKIDLLADNECSVVIKFVEETIRTQSGIDAVKIFPLSARLGLAARISRDAVLYEQSGLKNLEENLASFLSGEKSSIFLASVTNKILQVLHDEAMQDAFGDDAIEARLRAKQEEKYITIHRDPHSAVMSLISAWSKLKALYEETTGVRDAEIEGIEVHPPVFTVERSLSLPTPSVKDIETNLLTRGCSVCQHLTINASDFFSHWQYQISTEVNAQNEFAVELGFCPLHTWQLLSVTSPHGASIGFSRLVDQVVHHLSEIDSTHVNGITVQQFVHDSRNCRVCELLRQSEKEYILRLALLVSEPDGINMYIHSQGVCLRHLGMLLDEVSSSENREFLLSHSIHLFEEDAQDMRSFALKHEALRRILQNRNEVDAYRRAVIRIFSGRGVSVPWPEDKEI